MPPVVCIVGRPKSGKTRLITGLIPELQGRGHRVATVKHTTHDFETDTAGKDSFLHFQAGSECAVLSSAGKVALTRRVAGDLSPAELGRLISDDFDIVLAEGFKRSDGPKIEVHRREIGDLVCDPAELLAVVTDAPLEVETARFSPEDLAGIAGLIETKLLKRRDRIAIFADGKPVPLKPFIRALYHKLILDLAVALKGVGKPKRIDISIRD